MLLSLMKFSTVALAVLGLQLSANGQSLPMRQKCDSSKGVTE
jgi:hypothetical protein